jgi:hypothetical protein
MEMEVELIQSLASLLLQSSVYQSIFVTREKAMILPPHSSNPASFDNETYA